MLTFLYQSKSDGSNGKVSCLIECQHWIPACMYYPYILLWGTQGWNTGWQSKAIGRYPILIFRTSCFGENKTFSPKPFNYRNVDYFGYWLLTLFSQHTPVCLWTTLFLQIVTQSYQTEDDILMRWCTLLPPPLHVWLYFITLENCIFILTLFALW